MASEVKSAALGARGPQEPEQGETRQECVPGRGRAARGEARRGDRAEPPWLPGVRPREAPGDTLSPRAHATVVRRVHLELEGSTLSPRNPVPQRFLLTRVTRFFSSVHGAQGAFPRFGNVPPRLFLPGSVPSPWEPGLVPVAPCLPLFPNRAFGSRDTCSSDPSRRPLSASAMWPHSRLLLPLCFEGGSRGILVMGDQTAEGRCRRWGEG